MAAMDRDTFIPLGTSIVKLLLLASGQGALATAVGEGAGLLARFRRTLEIGGNRAVFAEKIADDTAKQLLREHQGISEADWHVAARQTATLIDRLSKEERLAAGYNWEELRRTLLDLGGTDLRSDLADESARQAFDWVLEVACQRVADCFIEKEALASILESVEEVRSGIQRLAERPAGASQTRAVVADHMEVVRDLAPDPLEDRERELVELKSFVHGSQDTWYAMEAGMISGKTALMSSFTLNPPSDVHIVSFFIRRMGGDGNDWKSFSFVAGAQLAEILGDEYTERVSEPASQNTEFRQLLRRAATACQSDKNPRPLVLVIDGVDEDSYYEDPDAPGAKSILSLLPRHIPEGVKLVTASRLNPRMPEDIVCNASRVVVSLKPSPIAQEKINQKDIGTFFKSDLAVDIGAFLAACDGSLTINEMRQLIAKRRHIENIPSRDVKACVEHSPGRMLMRVSINFSDREVESYALGHDAVLQAVLRETAPSLFGENNEAEDEAWWAQVRRKALEPYRAVIREWVEYWKTAGWGKNTPNYMLTAACFDLITADNRDSSTSIVLNQGRYREMLNRCSRKSRVLKVIDQEYLKVLEMKNGELSECIAGLLFEVVKLRGEIIWVSSYVAGLLDLHAYYLEVVPEVALDMALTVDEGKGRMNALKEAMNSGLKSKHVCKFVALLPRVIESLLSYQGEFDSVRSAVVDIMIHVADAVKECGNVESDDLHSIVGEVVNLLNLNDEYLNSPSSSEEVGDCDGVICLSRCIIFVASKVAEQIDDAPLRAQALVNVAGSLTKVGNTYGARLIAKDAVRVVTPFQNYLGNLRQAFVDVVKSLARVGLVDETLEVIGEIDDVALRAEILMGVVGALACFGRVDEAIEIVEQYEDTLSGAQAMVYVACGLAKMGDLARAQQVAEEAVGTLKKVSKLSWSTQQIFVDVAGSLARAGLVDESLKVVVHIDDSEERAQAMVYVACGLAKMGDLARAQQVAEEAVGTLKQLPNLWWNGPQIFADVARSLARAGLVDASLKVVEHIDNPEERAQAMHHVVSLLTEPNQFLEALSFAKRLDGFGSLASIAFDLILKLIDEGRLDECLDLCEQINESWVHDQALIHVSIAFAREGRIKDVQNVIKRFRMRWSHTRVRECVAVTLAGKGWGDEALDFLEQIADFYSQLETMVDMVEAMANGGWVDEALVLADRINVSHERVQALRCVVRVLVRSGDLDTVRRVVEEIVVAIRQTVGALSFEQVLVDVAGELAKAGMVDEAFKVVEPIEDLSVRTQVLFGVATELAKEGRGEDVIKVIDRIEGCVDHKLAMVCLARELVDVGLVDEAFKVMGPMNDLLVSDVHGEVVLMEVASVLVKSGQVDEALKVVGQVDQLWDCTPVLVEAASTLTRSGRIDEALKVVDRIDEPEDCGKALMCLARILVSKGDVGVATSLTSLAWSLIRKGDIDATLEIILAGEGATSIRVSIYVAVIEELVSSGLFDDAINVLHSVLAEVKGFLRKQDGLDCCIVLTKVCFDTSCLVDVSSPMRERWLGLARSALARSWLYGASVWDHFDILVRVAPELAVQLVDERILADPGHGADPESDPDLGSEGPGGNAGSYR